jgi:hypothetical protein
MRRYTVNMLRRERLVDKLVEAYVDWRETCAGVSDAYRSRPRRPPPVTLGPRRGSADTPYGRRVA